jgi:FecR protein
VREPRWLDGERDPVAQDLRKALGEAQLCGPDDVTLRRLWERARLTLPELSVPERPARTPRWIWFAGGMASTAAFAFVCAAWLWPHADVARAPVATAPRSATPTVAAAQAHPAPVADGTVRTGLGERLQLNLAGGTEARLESSTVMTMDHEGRPTLDGGEVAFRVPHQQVGHSYVVLAGPYRVVVLGTKFRLRLDEHHRVFVDVDEGVVEVWDHARLARLVPGQTWSSPDETEAAANEVQADEPRATERATQHTAQHTTQHMVKRKVALVTPGASEAPGATDDPAARAQEALTAGEVSRALTLYRALAQRGGPAGENAAYEIGKILRDRLGQPGNAVAAWRRYRAEHPNGILRIETDVSIIETLVHAGDTSGALAEANEFLRNHPDSERRAEIARVAGDLYRTRADCRRAVTAYQAALTSPLGRDAAEPATFHRAECLIRLGEPGGTDAARAYLKRWPSGRFRSEAERLLESGDDSGAARL